MKKLLFVSIILITCIVAGAQVVDTTAITPGEPGAVAWEQWKEIIGGLVALAIWLAVRLIPNKKNWDIIAKVFRVLGLIFPNRKSGGGRHV